MLLKKLSSEKTKNDTRNLNLIDTIRYSIGTKRVNRAIKKARDKNENECCLNYWIIESIEEELKKKGYVVVMGEIQLIYSCYKYTYISW